jgi:hypothetical protein
LKIDILSSISNGKDKQLNPKCTGCLDLLLKQNGIQSQGNCGFSKYNTNNNLCPCSLCIVKCMCEDICADAIKWRKGMNI